MSHSIFGWSYPPGCNSVPGDEPCPPCSLCGKDPEGGCSCPECSECGTVGCIQHLSLTDLITRIEILSSQHHDLNAEYLRRQREKAVKCPGCGKEILPDLVDGGPDWCSDCKRNIGTNGQFLPEDEIW